MWEPPLLFCVFVYRHVYTHLSVLHHRVLCNDLRPLHARFPGILRFLQLNFVHRHVHDDLPGRGPPSPEVDDLRMLRENTTRQRAPDARAAVTRTRRSQTGPRCLLRRRVSWTARSFSGGRAHARHWGGFHLGTENTVLTFLF